MKADPARTLLVLSARPHPWALLRDRLDPGMVRVAWRRPAGDAPVDRCWAVAGEPPSERPATLRWPLLLWWVGDGPDSAQRTESWPALAEHVEAALASELGGIGLAPTCGLRLADGTSSPALPALETLLSAGPAGVALPDAERPSVRRVRTLIDRHHLPFELVVEGGRAALRRREERVRPA